MRWLTILFVIKDANLFVTKNGYLAFPILLLWNLYYKILLFTAYR